MHPKSAKLLDDVVQACQYISEDTDGETLDTFLRNRRVRQLVERNLHIIGEALIRLRKTDPETAARIVGLRNRLAHGYDQDIDDTLIWLRVEESLPVLRAEVEALLPQFEP